MSVCVNANNEIEILLNSFNFLIELCIPNFCIFTAGIAVSLVLLDNLSTVKCLFYFSCMIYTKFSFK